MNRMRMMAPIFSLVLFLFLLTGWSVAGTTGKIAGQITDAETGEPLAGVNVYLEGTTLGAATDENGFYFIINVPPGTYNLKVSFIGYAEHTISNVEVQLDLTTNIDVALRSEIMSTEAVVVVAERPVIQKDVAGSQINISKEDIEILPVTTVEEVVGLQAGVTSDLGIRGSGADQALFVVDGISMRDNRTNDPISEVPLSALQEISVQSGGVSAEYSNVRSGVINVVTREGDPNRYSGTLTFKMKPPQPKHFGISPYDKYSFWNRAFFDPDVMWTGTDNGAWDKYTKRQYYGFEGWNSISQKTLTDDDPTNDLTPEAAKRVFEWQHRKQGDIKKPDYNIDAGFGGPVPFISQDLGNLRFFASYKREQDMYLIELATDALTTESYMLRLASDLSPSMKLSILGLYSETYGTNISRSGLTDYFTSTNDVAAEMDRTGFTVPWRIYMNIYYSRTARYSHTLSAKLTNVVNPSTFWEAKITKVGKNYRTGPGRYRDLEKKYEIVPGYFVDEAPVGYFKDEIGSIDGRLSMGGAVSTSRDTSNISSISAKFDITSQIHRSHQIKAGIDLTFNNYDMSFGLLNFFLPEGNTWSKIEQNPFVGSLYIKDKIEYEGFIANAGVIFDYYNSRGKWYQVDPFDTDFYSKNYDPSLEDEFKTKEATQRFTISPRLSISHPIGENSKLFFNYGHFRQMPTSERQFRLQRTPENAMDYVGDPTIPLASTISYELGFDQSLFDEYLIRAAAYYKDVTDQEFWVRYINSEGAVAAVNYYKITNNSYEDIRGFELDLTKRTGKWVTGNINYEYRVGTSGYFGIREIYENPAEQRDYLRRQFYQEKPRARPRIKSYINVHTPKDLGPKFAGQTIFGDWNFTFISRWTSGLWGTWNPNNLPGIEYNFQWNDYYNVDLRIVKIFPFKTFNVKFFVDINNLFNFKYFSRESFYDSFDYDFYMKSLHLPRGLADELEYGNIPGDDNPGDYRKVGVEYVPMEWTRDEESLALVRDPSPRAIYYVNSTGQYVEYRNNEWVQVDKSRLDRIMDDKAYIDMPNQTYFTFLDPRSIFFGLSITYNF
jgi:hypothetical protein